MIGAFLLHRVQELFPDRCHAVRACSVLGGNGHGLIAWSSPHYGAMSVGCSGNVEAGEGLRARQSGFP